MPVGVDDVSVQVSRWAPEWKMLRALLGGTRTMRDAGKDYLPQWPKEEADSYGTRISTATLFPAYRRTLSVMAGKPFSSQLTLSEDTPAEIAAWADDIDREGVSLHVFAAEMFSEAFYGFAGILVDAPKQPEHGPRPLTQREQTKAGMRPYFARIKHEQFLGWRITRDDVTGARRLSLLRFWEWATEPDGEFGEEEVKQIRVLEPGRFRIFRKATDGGEWQEFERGATGLDFIPFVPIYGRREDFMCGAPPLIDLAYLNVEHWQSKSDQQTILHVARVPVLFAKGFAETDSITIGSMSAVQTERADADLKWVEHTGKAIEAGAKSLEQLESQMIQAGAELLVNRSGQRTATETANDAEGNRCDLLRMTEDFEDSLDQALWIMAQYARLPTGGNASLFKDFGAATLDAASATLVKDLAVGGIISNETAINELKRRGELAAEVDAPDEAEKVAAEGGGLGLVREPTTKPLVET